MRILLAKFIRDERAATALEYGLLAALVASVMIAGMSQLGDNLNAKMIAIGGPSN